NWNGIAQMMADWKAAGYFNVDCLTADYNAQIKAMAEDKVAFVFLGNSAVNEMQSVNPDVNLGFMSVPASSDTDEPTLIGGERIAIGVWKDSENKEAALELLSYFAQDDNMAKIASADGAPASFEGVTSDTGIITSDLEKYMASSRIFPYFDREYLPNGMWDDMCITGASILAEDAGAVEGACTAMEQSYNAKMEIQ
ncbi:MAG: extracellular solute-binding protein, partial [Kineothrix sp.]|nr:extracellular solute-binding protein [Kineothrix sp.]